MRLDQVKMPDGSWRPINSKKLIKRLCSNSHAKLKSIPPPGFKTIRNYIATHPEYLQYVGDNLKREFGPQKVVKKKHRQGPTVLDVDDEDDYVPGPSKRKR